MLLLVATPMGLIGLLIFLIIALCVLGLVWWATNRLTAAFGIPEPVKSVIIVALVVVCVLIILYVFLAGVPMRGLG